MEHFDAIIIGTSIIIGFLVLCITIQDLSKKFNSISYTNSSGKATEMGTKPTIGFRYEENNGINIL